MRNLKAAVVPGMAFLLLTPDLAWAGPAAPLLTRQEAQVFGLLSALLAFGLAVFVLALLAYLLFHALFIRIAAGLLGLGGTFGTAFKAAFLGWVFLILFGLAAALTAPFLTPLGASALQVAASFLAGTLAIQSCYRSGFFAALACYLLSIVLTVVLVAGLVVALLMLGLGAAAMA